MEKDKLDKLDKCITELKVCLFDMFVESLKESDDKKKIELCEIIVDAQNDIHSLIGIIAELEAV